MGYYKIEAGTVRATGQKIVMAAIRYDETAIDAIKAIPGRKWLPITKRWMVPAEHKQIFSAIVEAACERHLESLPGPARNSYDQEHADECYLNGVRR